MQERGTWAFFYCLVKYNWDISQHTSADYRTLQDVLRGENLRMSWNKKTEHVFAMLSIVISSSVLVHSARNVTDMVQVILEPATNTKGAPILQDAEQKRNRASSREAINTFYVGYYYIVFLPYSTPAAAYDASILPFHFSSNSNRTAPVYDHVDVIDGSLPDVSEYTHWLLEMILSRVWYVLSTK